MPKINLTKSSFLFPEENRSPIEDKFQEYWNSVRESSVRGSVRLQTLKDARSHLLLTAKSVKKENAIAFIKGSYRITEEFSERESDHIVAGLRLLATRAMPDWTIYKVGMLSTGIIVYDDDTFDVCDPAKGVAINLDDGKSVKDITKAYTLYVIAIPK